jgi:hypothetical protein
MGANEAQGLRYLKTRIFQTLTVAANLGAIARAPALPEASAHLGTPSPRGCRVHRNASSSARNDCCRSASLACRKGKDHEDGC